MRVIFILWLRQIKKYRSSHSRIIGAIGQPLLFLLALGYGIGAIYKRAGEGNYIDFLVPGVVIQTILFSSIFWGINVVFDRLFGFLKEALVAPVGRLHVLLGSVLGGATISMLQGTLVLVIALFIGFRPYNWALVPVAFLIMATMAIAITALGAGLGSIIDNFPAFQSINNFIILPLYFLSGAFFPLAGAPRVLRIIAEFNPLSYAVDAMRDVLIHQSHFGIEKDFLVLGLTVVILVSFGTLCFRRIQV
ncbi:MAG TPA: ABC transporter permease [Candidatus Saccharimonadales bacterium]|nr:ABC transporter permease [Candidatus Saccharimonadales bacterium]